MKPSALFFAQKRQFAPVYSDFNLILKCGIIWPNFGFSDLLMQLIGRKRGMAKAKSNRRNLALRQQRARQKKQAKRATRRRSSRQQTDYIARPALSDMEAPEGFRAIPMSQAMIHYAQPILEKTQSEEELQSAMNAAMLFWNYSLLREKEGKSVAVAEVEKGIVDALKASLKIDAAAAKDFTEMMFQRHCYLFPEDIQPRGTPFAFIRKEKRYRIEPIAEDRIRLNTEPIAPIGREEKIFQDLRRLEELVEQEADSVFMNRSGRQREPHGR